MSDDQKIFNQEETVTASEQAQYLALGAASMFAWLRQQQQFVFAVRHCLSQFKHVPDDRQVD